VNSPLSTRVLLVASGAAILLCVVAGPFGTGALPLATRTLVWATLISVNAFKWWAWYRWLAPRLPDRPAADLALAGAGALLLNATLPLEIGFVYRAVGIDLAAGWFGLWLTAVLISLSIMGVVTVVSWRRPAAPEVPAARAEAPPRGLALKADLSRLLAVTAEDHYLRLHLDGGEKPLLLYRFGDALADLRDMDGLQVHRSAWVADRAVRSAERAGRRWWLRLTDGTRLPVSDRHLPAVRARGWLARQPG